MCYKQLFTNTCMRCKQFLYKERKILFLKKIDLSYSLVVFFVFCPHLRPFSTIFTRLAPFWCSAAKTDYLLAVEQENNTNSLKMPQNSLRHGQLKNKKYNKVHQGTPIFLKNTEHFFSLFKKPFTSHTTLCK